MGLHGLTPLMTVAAWLELVGDLLILGLFTQLIAFVAKEPRHSCGYAARFVAPEQCC